MTLKEQMEIDALEVFSNTDEFAEEMEIEYKGEPCTITATLDDCEISERQRLSEDYADGLSITTKKLYIATQRLTFEPKQNSVIYVNNIDYKIKSVDDDGGFTILTLERADG